MESLQPNSVELNPIHKQHEYIIESKHSLSKEKVDKKIAQMLEIKDVFLQSMPIKETPKYVMMISQLRFSTGQTDLNYQINQSIIHY